MAFAKASSDSSKDPSSTNISAIQSRLDDLMVSINGAAEMAQALAGYVDYGGPCAPERSDSAVRPVPSSPFDRINTQINDALSLLVDMKKDLHRVEARVS